MRHVFGRLLFVVLTFVASALGAAEPASPASPAQQHVILITLDGFPARSWHDEALPVPNLRRLARQGAAAEAMTVSNPSITWINHTTLVTGVNPRRHGVLYNGLLVRGGPQQPPHIEPWVDKQRLVSGSTIYDLAYRAGLTTAEVNWVAVTRPGTINWSFPEIPAADGAVEKEMFAAGLLRPEQMGWFHGPNRKTIIWEDAAWARAACFIFQKHCPNLLLFHLLAPDSLQHQYGPGSPAAYAALAYADRLVGDLLDVVGHSPAAGRTTVMVTCDHGFKKVAKIVYPNVLLKQAGLLTVAGATITHWDAVAMAQGGLALVYVSDPARKAQLLPVLKTQFAAAEGVARVLDGGEGPTLGMPTPAENPGMGELILFAKDGYAFKAEAAGDAAVAVSQNYLGTHGYPASDPELDGIFIAQGNRIKPGVSVPRMANLDVAPTIAHILGLQIPNAEGRVLTEVLQ